MASEKISIQGIIVWLVCVSFYLYEFLLRTILGTFQGNITYDLNLSPTSFAVLSSTAFLFIYGIMQIPVGIILRKWGLKKGLFFASIICCASTLGFSYSSNFGAALLFRSLMGLGAAFGFICVLYSVYDWIPYKKVALYIGLSQFLGTLGPMGAAGPLNSLGQSSAVGWRTVFLFLSLIGLILSILIFFFVDKNKKLEGSFLILQKPLKLTEELFSLLRDKQVLYIALFCAFNYFSLEYLSENEGKSLLMSKGFSNNFSSYMITLAWLGFAIGSPIFGYLSDRMIRRKPFLMLSSFFVLLSLIFILYIPLSHAAACVMFLIFGLGVGGGSIGIVIMGEQFQTHKISTGLGVNNSITILFVSLLAPCISYFLTYIAKGHSYSLANFQSAFSFLVGLPFLALIITHFKIKETFAKSSKENIVLKLNNK